MTTETLPGATPTHARILFVDDDPNITTSMRRWLSREPFEVKTANSAAEAQELLADHTFEVVVADEIMPGTRGSEFLGQLRRDRPEVVRILMTGEQSLETAIKAVNEGGIFRFIRKPCEPREISRNLHDAVAYHRAHAPPASLAPPPDPALAELQTRYDRAVDGLWMAMQPVVSAPLRNVYAYECLVRTREPSVPHGGAFVELAERLSQSQSLDRFIRARVATMLRDSADDLMVLVNLHPSSLDDDDLFAPEAPLSAFAGRVVLEITERAALTDMKAVRDKVQSLRNLGYRIAVDDLGAGYAGLQSLVILTPEIVKIDMELVRNIDTSPTKATLVAAVITLCRQLGAKVIAEGIETDEEFRALQSMGCEFLQGYYFAKPGPAYPAVRWPS
jgi:EAL domain-containing protein (putative c-di-GMP-specific phosphodiesterase class I)